MGYIYKVTNTVNGKMYIGQTRNAIEKRWKQHVYNSFHNAPYDKGPFHMAIKKYGSESFVVEQIEECDDADLNVRETYWINQFDSRHKGYNVTNGGEHHFRCSNEEVLPLWNDGLSVKEIAEKLGVSRRVVSANLDRCGITPQEKVLRGQRVGGVTSRKPIYMYDRNGNYITEFPSKYEAAEAIGFTGRVIRNSFLHSTICGYQFRRYKIDKLDTSIMPHQREVHQYSLDGDYIATYPSLRAASRAIGETDQYASSIGAACRDGRTQAYGYRWSFEQVTQLPSLFPSKKCRPVIRISIDGKEHKEYCSAAQAGRENGVSYKAILDACTGKQKHSAGYCWEYAEK